MDELQELKYRVINLEKQVDAHETTLKILSSAVGFARWLGPIFVSGGAVVVAVLK
jgi:hypothetical protein